MRSRRDTELWLLIAALPILVLLFAMLLINQRQDLTFSSFAVPLGLFAAFVLAHLTTRRFAPNADPALLPISFLLSGIGICFVMRLAPSLAMKQLCWLFLGIAAMVVTLILVRSLENLANYKYSVMIVGLLLLLLPAVIGTEIYGSKIWITFAGFSFQPGEIAKVLIVIFLAAYMAQNRELLSVSNKRFLGLQIPHLRTLAPLLIMWAIAMLIVVFERDLGSAMLVFGIVLIMLYVCSGRPAAQIEYVLEIPWDPFIQDLIKSLIPRSFEHILPERFLQHFIQFLQRPCIFSFLVKDTVDSLPESFRVDTQDVE